MPELRAVPARTFSRDFQIYDGTEQVGQARVSALPSRGTLTLRGVDYTGDGAGLLRRAFELRRAGGTLYRLVPSGLVRHRVDGLDRTAFLKAAGPLWRHFRLQHGDRTLGTIRPKRLLGRAAIIDFDEELPETAAAFLLITSILMWRRRARRARS